MKSVWRNRGRPTSHFQKISFLVIAAGTRDLVVSRALGYEKNARFTFQLDVLRCVFVITINTRIFSFLRISLTVPL